jgi:gas vesicle protein
MVMNQNGGSRIACFFFGLGSGALLALLFAPKSGKDIRADLEEGKDYLQHRAHELRERAEDLVERGQEIAAEQKERIAGAIEVGRETYRSVKSESL